MGIAKIFDKLFDLIYPPRCPICDEIIPIDKEKRICDNCLEELPYILTLRCAKCSKPIEYQEQIVCFDCSKKKKHFEKGWALFLYKEPIASAIHKFKYRNKRDYGILLAKEINKHYEKIIKEYQFDVIIPVPIHNKRFKVRGYNQAMVIAKVIGSFNNITVNELIIRCKNTKPQKELSDKERYKNLKGAFKLKERNNTFNKILIVDDIYTTGSTIDTCAKLLKEDNSNCKVFFITLCIGKGW